MACTIAHGRLYPCNDSVGGIETIYIVNNETDFFSDLVYGAAEGELGNNQVTDSNAATAYDVFEYKVEGTTNTLEITGESNLDNATRFYTQNLTVTLPKLDADTEQVIDQMMKTRPRVIVKDYNDNYVLLGAQNGLTVGSTGATGGAMGDLSGYTLTFEGMETRKQLFLSSSAVPSAGGTVFDIKTTNISL